MTTARATRLVGPRQVEVVTVEVRAPAEGEVLVRTEASGLSAGSERLVFLGQVEPDVPLDATLPSLAGASRYPLAYGYCTVGRVEALGPGVDSVWLERRVFVFHPHQSRLVVPIRSVVVLPDAPSAEAATMLANLETAVSFLMDARPLLGETMLVLGAGVVGQLVAGIASRLSLGRVVVVDPREDRRVSAAAFCPSAQVVAQPEVGMADVVFEVSGAPEALETALTAARYEGRVVVGSWYGERAASLHLGTRVHRNRNTILFSQVSRLDSGLTGRFDTGRRMAVALDWLTRLPLESLVTHRLPLEQAAEAYALLAESPPGCLHITLAH